MHQQLSVAMSKPHRSFPRAGAFVCPAFASRPIALRQPQDRIAVALAGAAKGPKMFNHLRIQPHVALSLRVARVLVAHETKRKRKRSGDRVEGGLADGEADHAGGIGSARASRPE